MIKVIKASQVFQNALFECQDRDKKKANAVRDSPRQCIKSSQNFAKSALRGGEEIRKEIMMTDEDQTAFRE